MTQTPNLTDSSPKVILILHGIGGHAGIHWQKWLHDELQARGHIVLMPDLPKSHHPDRKQWLSAIKQALKAIDTTQLVIVGHSLGVTSALDFIEQSRTPVRALVSVSGFAIDYGAELNSYFLSEKTINFSRIRSRLQTFVALFGNDDPYVAPKALRQLAEALAIKPIIIDKGGHLNTATGYTTFPQLLDIILQCLRPNPTNLQP